MNYRSLKTNYMAQLRKKGLSYIALSIQESIESTISFYLSKRVYNTKMEANGDMLLYQWGTYDWGKGKFFQVDITRQIIVPDSMHQMSTTVYFESNGVTDKIGSGNKWCEDLEDVESFKQFIDDHQITKKLEGQIQLKSSVVYSPV